MISSKKKGFTTQNLTGPSSKKQGRSELSYLPKYIAYKAALLREKLVLTYVIAILSILFAVYFAISRFEISRLYDQLRTKEFILAPGVQDFTAASPQSVPASYVHDAASDFLSSLGNVNASNIHEEYEGLKRFMSDSFKIQFDVETREWIKQVQTEDLAQIVKIKRKEIVSDGKGAYRITAFARADFYAVGQYLGHEDQVIEMELSLIPPDRKKRWYLQIESLTWSKLENFRTKSEFQKDNTKKESK